LIAINIHTDIVHKIPKTLAAKNFLNKAESETYKILSGSDLKDYLPGKFSFNPFTAEIKHEFIKGVSGHELLSSKEIMKNKAVVSELKIFYNKYTKFLKKYDLNLDIHPGNFILEDKTKKWFLIDTGSIPKIGSNYFPIKNWNSYFKKIWLERSKRMKVLPIRSVLLG